MSRLLPLAPLLLFLALAIPYLDLPGLHYDEALEAGLPAAQLLNGQSVTAVNGGALRIGDLTLPLMTQNHIGAAQVYAALPFVFVGGPTAFSLRMMTVVSGAVTLLAVYLFTEQVYGRAAALSASLWLAAFPSFIFWSRQGAFVTSLAPCFAMCAFAAGAYWWRSRRPWAIGLVGLFAGLAIYSKLSALWLLTGLIAWGLLTLAHPSAFSFQLSAFSFQRPSSALRPSSPVARPPSSVSRRNLALALVGMLLGCWPFVLYNIITGGATLRVVQLNATETYLGANNVDVIGNLQTRLAQAADVIRSGEHLWYLGAALPNNIALVSVLIALAVLLIDMARTRGIGWRSALLMPFLGLAIIAQSCYTISALWPTHFAVAAPLPAIIFGVAVGRLWGRGLGVRGQGSGVRGQGWEIGGQSSVLRPSSFVVRQSSFVVRRSSFVTLVVLLVAASQIQTTIRYLDAVRTTGGLSFHSSAIYDLSRFLDERDEHVVALDWGIAATVRYLTDERVVVEEFYGYEQVAPPSFGEALRERFSREELYITHAEHQEAFQRRTAFLQAVADAGLRAERLNVSVRADGWPMLEVWRVTQ